MANLRGFNANEHGEMQNFDALPEGRYLARIAASERRPTKDGEGALLEFTFEVIQGPHKGRKVWSRLNLENKSSEAVRIANCELAAICKAVGVLSPEDSSELHDKPLLIALKVEKRRDNGELTNRIKGYYSRSEANKPAAAAPVASAVPPWARRTPAEDVASFAPDEKMDPDVPF